MSPSEDVMDALTALNPGDDVTITVVREGDELELDGYVTDAYREEPEKHGFGYVKGSLSVDVELANSAVERLQDYEGQWLRNATHSVDISAKERRPGKWDDPSITIWDPEADGGMVTRDHWTVLGELRSVQRVETDGGEDTEDVVDAFADAMADLMTGFSDVEPDEKYSTRIKLFIRNREGDDPKVAVSGFTIIGPEEHQRMEREVLDRVDLRKAPKPDGSRARAKTVDIGTVTFLGTGEILETDISPEYLKPSERGDSDE